MTTTKPMQARTTTVPALEPTRTFADLVRKWACGSCNASGRYSETQTCFRCRGKGYQTADDLERNARYKAWRESKAPGAA